MNQMLHTYVELWCMHTPVEHPDAVTVVTCEHQRAACVSRQGAQNTQTHEPNAGACTHHREAITVPACTIVAAAKFQQQEQNAAAE
jgi:hypothetical protein